MSKQEECNKCKTAGFPGQLINFRKSTRINPATNKPFWDLINPDGSDHEHKQNGVETMGKTPQNDQLVIDATRLVRTIETLTESVNALVFAVCADTELQRVQARAMVSK